MRNFLLLILTLIFITIVLELVFRLARPNDALRLSMGTVDAAYHHKLKPNASLHMVSSYPGEFDVTAHINELGFRGSSFKRTKSSGAFRILMMGDSFTFGVGAEDSETIPYLTQERLSSENRDVEVINAGVGHYSPIIHYLRLRDELFDYDPDLVVVMLDFSDLWDDWRFEKLAQFDSQGKLSRINPYDIDGHFSLWRYLRSKSVLAKWLHNKVVRTVRKIGKLGLMNYLMAKVSGKRAKAVIAGQEGETIEFDGRLFLRGGEKADEIKAHFGRTASYVLKMKALLDERGIPFVLVIYPYGTHVGANQWHEGRLFWGFEQGRRYDDLFSFELIEAFCDEHAIPVINLLEPLRQANDRVLYFPYDGHFTPTANRVVARALGEEISARLEVKERGER